jgi:hypothetical protein
LKIAALFPQLSWIRNSRFRKSAERNKNKITPLGPFNGYEYQSFLKTGTDLRGIRHAIQGNEGNKEAVHNTNFLQRKISKNSKILNLWANQLFADFRFSSGLLTPRKAGLSVNLFPL